MWVFIEKVGDLYAGVAHDDDGRQLIEITEPTTGREVHALMADRSEGDCYDVDDAIDEADARPDDGRTPERKFFYLLRVRAKAGVASPSDGAWVVDQLRDPNSIHRTPLSSTTQTRMKLGTQGTRYTEWDSSKSTPIRNGLEAPITASNTRERHVDYQRARRIAAILQRCLSLRAALARPTITPAPLPAG